MNFIFISPHYPEHFREFTTRLKERGVTVLGIGDCPYSGRPGFMDGLSDYTYVNSLEDYESVYRATASYIARYGRIDYIESQNEYWLPLDARLRSDFNIKTGPNVEELVKMNHKSKMKEAFKSAGVPSARYILPTSLEEALAFADKVGYPVIIKPDKGVGATDTHKLTDRTEIESFWKNKLDISYIEEEFVPGHIETFDGITNSRSDVILALSQLQPVAPLEVVDSDGDVLSYCVNPPDDLREAGEKILKAFVVRNRFFHFEFFRLDESKKGLGKKGSIVALEVNMRAPGGFIPDEMNYALDSDVYTIWADSIIHDRSYMNCRFSHYVTHVGRKNSIDHKHSDEEVRDNLKDNIVMEAGIPALHAREIGDHVFLVRADSIEERDRIISYMLERN
ncbi:MAG: hypothetical protein K6G51_05885 [Sphaerochaetaceae bacterium]|nr:hypothetical protein [Sphaerochaetaceae bacterium]